MLDQIAGCVDSGSFTLEIDLRAGRVPVADAWTVEAVGTPTVNLVATAVAGHVNRLDLTVSGGTLLLDGNHLRPRILVKSLRFEAGKGITEASYRGRGIWRPIVWVFRGLATSALRKLEFRTDILSVLHGDVLNAKGAAAEAARGEPPIPPASSAPSRGPAFIDLVKEVRIHDSEFVAYGGRPLSFGPMIELHTASQSRKGTPVRVAITAGVFRPAREGQPEQFGVVGRVDGEIENGAIAFVGSRCTFSHGELREGAFQVGSPTGGTIEASLSAAALTLDLTAGELDVPGGPRVDVEAPSHFVVRDFRLRPDGQYSGIVDAELFGKAGRIQRDGVVVALSDVKLRTTGVAIANGRATGDVQLESKYRMDYPLVVRYPVAQVGERRVQLLFQGALATKLHLQDAGSGGEGTATGEYRFTVPWPPIEQAAFEVLRAKWIQDIPPVMRKVDFVIDPRRFGPCGGTCFLVSLDVTVEKKEAKGRLFRQICDAQGKADLVVDAASRSFLLRNVRIEPRCRGIVGWVVNFIGPLLTTTYNDVVLFQMPTDLPFTIESVDSGSDWIAIAGKVAWTSKASAAPPKPSP
ncbi:MAG: hypothetical protein B7Z61_03355 [Acidobacteria bacterium 37-71-11]|nr:MAG: hypothetical protein B7Z61_03355 [Acidobacteria bacterium 37-71-11]HQT95368.1 hypothetical protein [Thermoanaerobaculaceae bacterium]